MHHKEEIKRFVLRYVVTDKFYLKFKWKSWTGSDRKLDLKNPKTFNEKLQWLKLYNRNPLYTQLADKYEVRKYVASTIGEEHLVPLLGVWDSLDDIDYDSLPNRFVIKCTHDSGGYVICQDKANFDFCMMETKLRRKLNRNYFYLGREWPYKYIKPRIVAEKNLGENIYDYKLYTFNGIVKVIEVDIDRHTNLRKNFYTVDWAFLPMSYTSKYPSDSEHQVEKPKVLDQMISMAQKLSAGIPFVRIDLFVVRDGIYFGEMTFFPIGGTGKFTPEEYNEIWGEWIELPKKRRW